MIDVTCRDPGNHSQQALPSCFSFDNKKLSHFCAGFTAKYSIVVDDLRGFTLDDIKKNMEKPEKNILQRQ